MKKKKYNDNWIDIDGNKVHETAIIYENVKLGVGNVIGPYTVIGSNGEIRGKDPEEFKGGVIIGNYNVISEHVTIQRPFEEKNTRIGNNNIIMAHSHVGHDALIGSNCEICTSVVVSGHCVIYDGVRLKVGSLVRNRKQIFGKVTIGLGAVVASDIRYKGRNPISFVGIPAKKLEKSKSKNKSGSGKGGNKKNN